MISCSDLMNNLFGVFAAVGSDPTVVDCRITGNTSYGVYNEDGSVNIVAENNWWGLRRRGPSGVGPGSGDAVGNFVDYTPWRTAFYSCLETIETIDLCPTSETNLTDTPHTVTATVRDEFLVPIAGITVSFNITSGPHAGGNGADTTDANGEATFTYTGTSDGTDTIEASFVNFYGRTIRSNAVKRRGKYPPHLSTPSL